MGKSEICAQNDSFQLSSFCLCATRVRPFSFYMSCWTAAEKYFCLQTAAQVAEQCVFTLLGNHSENCGGKVSLWSWECSGPPQHLRPHCQPGDLASGNQGSKSSVLSAPGLAWDVGRPFCLWTWGEYVTPPMKQDWYTISHPLGPLCVCPTPAEAFPVSDWQGRVVELLLSWTQSCGGFHPHSPRGVIWRL